MNKNNVLLETIVEGIQGVKGVDILSLNLQKIDVSICKYFVICSGNSNTHVSSIKRSIEKNVMQNLDEKPWHIESDQNSNWILMDYADIVVHIFQEETRKFYRLEEFWGDAQIATYRKYKQKQIS